MTIPKADTESPEEQFRLWAFYQYYRAYRAEKNLTHRFIRALVESSKPVPPDRVLAWQAAKGDIDQIERAFRADEITRGEWSEQIQAAIKAHTGAVVHNRSWVGEQADDLAAQDERAGRRPWTPNPPGFSRPAR